MSVVTPTADPDRARRFTSPTTRSATSEALLDRLSGRGHLPGSLDSPAARWALPRMTRSATPRDLAQRPARRPWIARPSVLFLRPHGPLRPHPQDGPGRRPGPSLTAGIDPDGPEEGLRPGRPLRKCLQAGRRAWSRLCQPRPRVPADRFDIDTDGPGQATLPRESNFTAKAYEDVVRHCQEYIKAGDIFQVVPSQRFKVETTARPFDIYRVLRVVNPSPFLFYLQFSATST